MGLSGVVVQKEVKRGRGWGARREKDGEDEDREVKRTLKTKDGRVKKSGQKWDVPEASEATTTTKQMIRVQETLVRSRRKVAVFNPSFILRITRR